MTRSIPPAPRSLRPVPSLPIGPPVLPLPPKPQPPTRSPEELARLKAEAREGARQLAAYAKGRRRLYYLRYIAKKKGKPRPPLHTPSSEPVSLPGTDAFREDVLAIERSDF